MSTEVMPCVSEWYLSQVCMCEQKVLAFPVVSTKCDLARTKKYHRDGRFSHCSTNKSWLLKNNDFVAT